MDEKVREAKLSNSVPVEVIEGIARVCHETNRVYCQNGGDDSQVAWEKAPQWQKDSAMMGVHFVIDNQHAPASANHDSWMAQKLADGWKWGKVKDEKKKEHPCIVPYDHLPVEQQLKDILFRSIVLSFAGIFYDREPDKVVKLEDCEIYHGELRIEGDFKGTIVGSIAWAWDMMQKGYAMRLPSWKGYWKWDSECQTIVMYTKDGQQLDIRETTDVFYTMNGIADQRWEIAEDAGIVELNVATMPFSDALRYLRQNSVMVCDESNHLGVFICKENQLEVTAQPQSLNGIVTQTVIGKTGKLHFGEKLLCITRDGRIQGWNPGDDELLSKSWRKVYLSYDELVSYNKLVGDNAGSGE